MDSYLFCDRFDWRNTSSEFWTLERWRNNLVRWHHPHRYPEFKYIKIDEFWKNSQLVRSLHSESSVGFGGGDTCLFVSVHRSLQILSLSLLLLYAVWTSNNKWLLIVDGEFLFFGVANTQATLFQWIIPTIRRSSWWIVSFLVCGSFKHSMGTDKIDKWTIQKCDTIVLHRYYP